MKKTLGISISLLLLLNLSGCNLSFDSIQNDLDVTLDLSIIKTKVGVFFTNAASGDLIGDGSDLIIAVNIHGADNDQVLDSDAYFTTEFEAHDGYMEFSLNPYGKIPSPENPVKVIVVAQVEGYLQTSMPVTIISEQAIDIEIPMVEISNPCDGVEVKTQDGVGQAQDGILSEDLVAETDHGEVKIKVNAGTELTDRDGTPLNGELKVVLAYFSPSNEESLSAFPGGFTVTAIDENGQAQDGNFVTAGFVAIEISDQNGKIAANFDQGSLLLDMIVDSEVINYETDQPVQAGDEIPVWSYDVETGEWAFEQNIVVGSTPEGLRFDMELQHLSWWNLDWFVTGFCSYSKRFIFVSENEDDFYQRFCYKYKLYRQAGSRWVYWKSGTLIGYIWREVTAVTYNYLGWLNAPPWNVRIEWEDCDRCDDPLFNIPANREFYLCEDEDEYIYITQNAHQSVTIEAYINCTDTGERFVVSDNYRVRYRVLGQECWNYVWVYNGVVTINPVYQNSTYEVQVYDDGWKPQTPRQRFIGTEDHIVVEIDQECGSGG